MKKFVSILLTITVFMTLTSCSGFVGLREVTADEKNSHNEKIMPPETVDRQEFLPPFEESAGNIETISVTDTSEILSQLASALAGTVVTEEQLNMIDTSELFTSSAIDENLLERINGRSYKENTNISTEELTYLRMLHKNAEGQTLIGEMIVNSAIGDEILSIFKQLYDESYPIERMVLIDEYEADDESSMQDNNTSAFNYRQITGSTALSNHSYGMAIDINPFYNPYVIGDIVLPVGSDEYVERNIDSPYMIKKGDLCYELFTTHGYTWGGDWTSPIDYQHFEKIIEK